MAAEPYRSAEELAQGLERVRRSPADEGPVELIVRRPAEDLREVVEVAELDPARGLVGDDWEQDAGAGPGARDTQLTLMNARLADLVAGTRERWALAGDQLYVDLDLSVANLPAGARLAVGSAVVEITAEPHTGCSKFSARFGPDAIRLVNQPPGRELRLRGVNARILVGGTVRTGDLVRRLSGGTDPGLLEGTRWRPVPDPTGRATLELADGTAAGCAGVNRFTGPVALHGSALRLGPLASTRMAGPPEAMEAEDTFLAALGRATAWALAGDRLVLRDASLAAVLELEPAGEAPTTPV